MFLHQIFFYLTVAFLPTQLGLHFWPDWTLVLGRRIDYLSPTIFLTDITMVITFILWVCYPHNKGRRILPKILLKTYFYWLVALLYILFNIMYSPSPPVVLIRWIKVIELVLFGYYIVKAKPSLHITTIYISISMTYSSLLGIAQFVFQHSLGGVFWYIGERSFTITTPGIARVNWCWFTNSHCEELLRPYSTFPHPNVFAGFLGITICLLLWQILSHAVKQKHLNIWYIITICVSSIALAFTLSRGVWLISLMGMLTIFGITRKKTVMNTFTWICIASVLCITMAFPYYLSLFKFSESVLIRNELTQAAIEMWKSYPLIGIGFNAFLIQLPTVLPSRYQFFLQPPHSIYILTLTELGTLGTGIVIYCLFQLVNRLRELPDKLPLVILCIYGVLGLIDHYPMTVQQGQLLTTLILTLGFFTK